MENAAILANQVTNYKNTGNYSGGLSLGQLKRKSGLELPISDSDLQRLSQEAYKSTPDGGSYAFVPALSTYETKVFVRPGTNTAVVAFKGTDPKRVVDLYTDLRLATGHLSDTARVQRSRDTLKAVQTALPGYRIVATGHSLGGSLAREVSNTKGVTRAVGFNTGYSVSAEDAHGYFVEASKAHHKKYHAEHPKFTDYLNTTDAISIGSFLDRNGKHVRYKKGWGVKAHRPTYFSK